MASKKRAASVTATARLRQDFLRINRDPVPYITAQPLASNILEWRYIVKGPENSPYEGGIYHGKLVFPPEFPFKPPSIYMITPNGRFKVNTRLCLSISDFHPDTWNPAWSVSTILTGLLSFMLEKSPTLGSLECTDFVKRRLAVESGAFNLKDSVFCELFPDVANEIRENIRQAAESLAENGSKAQQQADENENGSMLNTAFTNVIAIISFGAFAYMVHAILTNLGEQ